MSEGKRQLRQSGNPRRQRRSSANKSDRLQQQIESTNQMSDAYQELLDDNILERASLETAAKKLQEENEVLNKYSDEIEKEVKGLRTKIDPHKAPLEDELRWIQEERKYLLRNRYFFYMQILIVPVVSTLYFGIKHLVELS